MASLHTVERLEKKLGIKLQPSDLESLSSWRNEYSLNQNNQIVGLSLYYWKSDTQISDFSFLKDIQQLHTLNLRGTQISDFSFLKDIQQLHTLTLSGTQISDFSFLKDIQQLHTLNLSGTQISDFSFLKDIQQLHTLDLSDTQISDFSFLKDIQQLHTLTLSGTQISDFSFLKDIQQLHTLTLSDTQISDFSFLKDILQLHTFSLSDTQISDFSFLKDILQLRALTLSDTQISDISFLKDIQQLHTLDLSENQISDISFLKDIQQLHTLDLSGNQISNISFLKDLLQLQSLNLSRNQISDFSFLKGLQQLHALTLIDNQISNISFLKDLLQLQSLNLSGNQVSDISILNCLKNLTTLWLFEAQITDISPLRDLRLLQRLQLGKNNISDLSPLRQLHNLQTLLLEDNQIEDLPPWIADFNMEIDYTTDLLEGSITLGENPIKNPPLEIVKQGKEAIKNYFEQLESQGKDYIQEAKLMLVGEPGSGKTTLMNKLFDRNFPVPNKEQKSTLGIDVRQNWPFQTENNKTFKAHIWDFGGQQIQYMLHQFFLTSDCLYVLMAEKRRELTNFDYWLNIINILGKNSPVLLVFNEINIDSATSFIYDEKKYRDLFSNLDLQKQDVNLAHIEEGRFDVLLNTMKQKLIGLEHIGKEVPAKWVDIRNELENQRQKKHIPIAEYFEICNQFEITKEADCLLILRYFHLLGIVLHFSEDENLCDTLFLDPNWTVDAVYSVLANKKIEQSNGIFKKTEIDEIWSEQGYDYTERAKLLQLMLKDNFDLCYKLPESEDAFIVPLLLPQKKPDYDWKTEDNLQFRFQYPFMPKGIVSRLIVRMHEYIDGDKLWHEGVVLHKNQATAQIIERTTVKEGLKFIEIQLVGEANNRKEFLTLIREEIKKIQDSSFSILPFYEMVPCNCPTCTSGDEAEFYDYTTLDTFLFKNIDHIQCRQSGDMVKILELIDAVGLKIVEVDRNQGSADKQEAPNQPSVVVKNIIQPTTTPDTQTREINDRRQNETSPDVPSWTLISLIAALPLGYLATSLFHHFLPELPISSWLSFLVFSALAFFVLLKQNPKRRFYRAAMTLILFASLNALPKINILLDRLKETDNGGIISELLKLQLDDSPLLAIAAYALAGFLFWLDSKQQ